MSNIYQEWLALLPPKRREVGTVTAVDGGIVTLAMPGGGTRQVIGVAEVTKRVFIRDGVIEGEAPALTYIEGEA